MKNTRTGTYSTQDAFIKQTKQHMEIIPTNTLTMAKSTPYFVVD